MNPRKAHPRRAERESLGTKLSMVVSVMLPTGGLVTEAAVIGAVVLLVLWVLPRVRNVVRQYLAFRSVPADPDQHFLLGHSPRVSNSNALAE